ncbi:hypothetical protein D3C84_683710 [compost metagenome]
MVRTRNLGQSAKSVIIEQGHFIVYCYRGLLSSCIIGISSDCTADVVVRNLRYTCRSPQFIIIGNRYIPFAVRRFDRKKNVVVLDRGLLIVRIHTLRHSTQRIVLILLTVANGILVPCFTPIGIISNLALGLPSGRINDPRLFQPSERIIRLICRYSCFVLHLNTITVIIVSNRSRRIVRMGILGYSS